MHRQATFGLQHRHQQFNTGNNQTVFYGADLEDEDSFEGKISEINDVPGFRPRFARHFVPLSPGETNLRDRCALWIYGRLC